MKGIPKRGLTEKGLGNPKLLTHHSDRKPRVVPLRIGPAGLFTILVVNICWLLFPKFVKYAGHRRFKLMGCDAWDLLRPPLHPPFPFPPFPLAPSGARRSGQHEKSLRRGGGRGGKSRPVGFSLGHELNSVI